MKNQEHEITEWDRKVSRASALYDMANGNQEQAHHWGANEQIDDYTWDAGWNLYLVRKKRDNKHKEEQIDNVEWYENWKDNFKLTSSNRK